jgi:Domain of unknown function (DUF5107)
MASDAFVRIDDRWSLGGLTVVSLENRFLRVVICPALGARVLHFEHRGSGTDLLWHNPRIEHRAVPIGGSYDDNFAGGWDELFPNDLAGAVDGEIYPDHGELWCQPWNHRIEAIGNESVTVHLWRTGAVTTTTVEKWITLVATESQLRFRHRISNHGPRALDFLWKLHPALAIEPGDRIDVPAKTAEAVEPSFGRIQSTTPFSWPVASDDQGSAIDLSVVPALDGTRDFVYTQGLTDGWCALRRTRLGIGFGLAFPTRIFNSVWLFMTFGGWRGLSTVVLEPCTTVPKDLVAAIRAGTARHLEPGHHLECEVRAILFEGTDSLTGFSEDGRALR